MSKFMIGDRVQRIGEPTDWDVGTVTRVLDNWLVIVQFDSSGNAETEDHELFMVHRPLANIELRAELDDCASVQSEPDPLAGWEKALIDSDPQDENPDPVNHPSHYTTDPSNVECITITRHRNFNIGNAIKYLWRNGLKQSGSLDGNAKQIEDLEKAVFYIRDEIQRLKDSK